MMTSLINKSDCPFVRGQEVIVRDWPHQKWQRRTFMYYDEGNNEPFVTDAHRYRYCKAYEDNEHLVEDTHANDTT